MAYLEGFGLENFRVFKEHTWFDFAPITILVGPNSSGKSSLIKALMLLQDNYERGLFPPSGELEREWLHIEYDDEEEVYQTYTFSTLSFNGGKHKLGSAEAVLAQGNFSNNSLGFTLAYPVETGVSYRGFLYKNIYHHFLYEVDKTSGLTTALHLSKISNDRGETIFMDKINSIYFNPTLYDEYFESDEDKISLWIENETFNLQISKSYKIDLRRWLIENGVDSFVANNLAKEIMRALGCNYFSQRSWTPLVAVKTLDFLVTNRNEQRVTYTQDDTNFQATLLRKYQQSKSRLQTNDFIKKYSDFFKLKDILDVKYTPEQGTHFPNIGGQALTSFGYGYTQIAAILIKIATNAAEYYSLNAAGENFGDSTIVLEEPETNLHPAFQSKLADLFTDAFQNMKQHFIIETHSEYMIRKFQYLVAKGEMKPEDIVIHYFHDPNNIPKGEKQVKKITILEDGSLSDDFGPGFYDEAANLELELLRLKRNKARQN